MQAGFTRTMIGLGGFMLLAAFSSSSTYQLQSYGINGSATNSSSSTTYKLESTTGQLQSLPSNSTSYTNKSGSIQAQQASTPPAPTLTNGSNTYYNKLTIVINQANPTSTNTYAVAISSNSFATTNYVQADGTIGTSPVYQTYVQWGSASGSTISGLSSGTAYQAKVSAMQGRFTASAYGPVASSATASPSLSFSVTPGSLTLPSLYSGTVVTSSSVTATITTNANYGASIYISDTNTGLKSISRSNTIASVSTTLSGFAHGYGAQGTGVSQSSGGPLSIVAPYNGTATAIGIITTTPQAIFSTGAPIVSGQANSVLMAKAANTDPASQDYSDTVAYTAAASF